MAGDNCRMRVLAPHGAGAAAAVGLCAVVAVACGSARPAPTPTPAGGATGGVRAQGSGCVSQSQAVQIWTDIDNRIIAYEANPKDATPQDATTGNALAVVQQYLAQQLVASNWTEREVDKLDTLVVDNAGCNNGTLTLHGTLTLVTDEYIAGDGRVDHHDPEEGQRQDFIDNYVRIGGYWKESRQQNPNSATPTATPEVI